MKLKGIFRLSFLLLACLVLAGCFNSKPEDIMAFTKPYQVNVNMATYAIQPPDEIQVICSKIPEVHEVIQRVRPDGKVSFEVMGEFDVAGKTTVEVAEMIKLRALTLYALAGDYPIDVRITKFASKYYYVMGQVDFPGPRLVTGRDGVINALALTQPNVLAWTDKIQVIRPSSDPNVPAKIFAIDLKAILKAGDTSKDVLLEQNDIVYVPPTVLAFIALKVEEFVRPIGRAFSTVNVVQGPSSY